MYVYKCPNIFQFQETPSTNFPSIRHQRHTLFNQNNNETGKNGGINYDIEAIKLDRFKHAWGPPGGVGNSNDHRRRHSISSEESLSDCEELGANHDNYHRESALQNSFR